MTIDWLEPVRWGAVDKELSELMGRFGEEVKSGVLSADWELSNGGEPECAGVGDVGGARAALLNGVRKKGGIVKERSAVAQASALATIPLFLYPMKALGIKTRKTLDRIKCTSSKHHGCT